MTRREYSRPQDVDLRPAAVADAEVPATDDNPTMVQIEPDHFVTCANVDPPKVVRRLGARLLNRSPYDSPGR